MEQTSLMSAHEVVTVGSFLKPKPQGRLLTLVFSSGEAKRGRRENEYASCNALTPSAAHVTCDTRGHWTPCIGLHRSS